MTQLITIAELMKEKQAEILEFPIWDPQSPRHYATDRCRYGDTVWNFKYHLVWTTKYWYLYWGSSFD